MAAAVVNHTPSLHHQGVSSVTFSHTIAAGAKKHLLVGVFVDALSDVSGITYGGVPLIRLAPGHASDGTRTDLYGYQWDTATNGEVPEGTADVVVTMAASATFGVVAVGLAGVDTSGVTSGIDSGSFNSPAMTYTHAVAPGLVVDFFTGFWQDAPPTPDAGQTPIVAALTEGGVTDAAVGVSHKASEADGGTTLGWTMASSAEWSSIGIYLPAAEEDVTEPPVPPTGGQGNLSGLTLPLNLGLTLGLKQ